MPIPEQIVPALLAWFPGIARDLPWRRTSDPYAIWISEVMLQQTQVQTVIPFWQRWMEAFPNVGKLASAKPERVLKSWEGLGYYRRARHLHHAAQIIHHQHQGVFPSRFEEILALPGIGRYTAGAVCSIAFDQPTPILDGNIVRVLARLYGITQFVSETRVQKRLWQLAEQLVRTAQDCQSGAARPCSTLNQALMELGALVCRPANPDCNHCPLQHACIARQSQKTDRLPKIRKKPTSTERQFLAWVATCRGRVLVRQRPADVVNGQLWEFPGVEVTGQDQAPEVLAASYFRSGITSFKQLTTIRHSITRYRMRLDVYQADLTSLAVGADDDAKWLTWYELEKLPFPSAHRKIISLVKKASGRGAHLLACQP